MVLAAIRHTCACSASSSQAGQKAPSGAGQPAALCPRSAKWCATGRVANRHCNAALAKQLQSTEDANLGTSVQGEIKFLAS